MVKASFTHFSPIREGWLNEIFYDTPSSLAYKFAQLVNGRGGWDSSTYARRSEVLLGLHTKLSEYRNEINTLIRIETGKTQELCEAEFDSALRMIRQLTAYEFLPHGELLPSTNPRRFTYSVRVPYGICLLIFPSNAPMPNFMWKLIPALMAGNLIFAKPSPYTSRTFEFILSLMRDLGLGEDVVQRVDGEGEVVKQLLELGLDMISFTGSTRVGIEIASLASPFLTKLILECGGINPFILDANSDLERATRSFIDSAFGNSGQRCAAASRVYVHESSRDSFLRKLEQDMSTKTTGIDESSDFGPMCSAKYIKSLNDVLDSHEIKQVHRFTQVKQAHECLFQPSLIEVNSDYKVLGETEIYGPVSILHTYSNPMELIELANNHKYGLTAAVWSRDHKFIEICKKQLKYGVVNINGPSFGSEPNFPFGGFGLSGNGTKEAGFDSINEYSSRKVISDFSSIEDAR